MALARTPLMVSRVETPNLKNLHNRSGIIVRTPDAIVIGGMKCGTTTLYYDLIKNRSVYCPMKESSLLLESHTDLKDLQNKVHKFFYKARIDQICMEVNTSYAKLPDVKGIHERAAKVFGSQFKVIYIVRDPVARIISHHHHDRAWGVTNLSLDKAVRSDPRYIRYSQYAMQIEPWQEIIGPENVHLIQFENYINHRQCVVARLCQFLGIDSHSDLIDPSTRYNESEKIPEFQGFFRFVPYNTVYRKVIRPLLGTKLRSRLLHIFFPQNLKKSETPSVQTVDFIVDHVRNDIAQLAKYANRTNPFWDVEAIHQQYVRNG